MSEPRPENISSKCSLGFFISALVFYSLNLAFPIPKLDQIDDVDVYGTFTSVEARRIGVAPLGDDSSVLDINSALYGRTYAENITVAEGMKI